MCVCVCVCVRCYMNRPCAHAHTRSSPRILVSLVPQVRVTTHEETKQLTVFSEYAFQQTITSRHAILITSFMSSCLWSKFTCR